MTSSGLNRITDPEKIRAVLDVCMRTDTRFLVAIFSREHRPGGISYVGHYLIAACQTSDERIYTLSISEGTNGRRSCGTLKLSGIEYVETLR